MPAPKSSSSPHYSSAEATAPFPIFAPGVHREEIPPAASGATGRPRGDAPEVLERVCAVIRASGLSDSAAARRVGVSTSSLGRWKVEHPGLKAALGQAREEFREAQLAEILRGARAEHGHGWRAAAWLLERIFPADYARTAEERDRAEQRELRQQGSEEAEEDVQRLTLQYAEQMAARAAEKAEAGAMPAAAGEARTGGQGTPAQQLVRCTPTMDATNRPGRASHNSQNGEDLRTRSESLPQPVAASILPRSACPYSQNSGGHIDLPSTAPAPTREAKVLAGSISHHSHRRDLAHAA